MTRFILLPYVFLSVCTILCVCATDTVTSASLKAEVDEIKTITNDTVTTAAKLVESAKAAEETFNQTVLPDHVRAVRCYNVVNKAIAGNKDAAILMAGLLKSYLMANTHQKAAQLKASDALKRANGALQMAQAAQNEASEIEVKDAENEENVKTQMEKARSAKVKTNKVKNEVEEIQSMLTGFNKSAQLVKQAADNAEIAEYQLKIVVTSKETKPFYDTAQIAVKEVAKKMVIATASMSHISDTLTAHPKYINAEANNQKRTVDEVFQKVIELNDGVTKAKAVLDEQYERAVGIITDIRSLASVSDAKAQSGIIESAAERVVSAKKTVDKALKDMEDTIPHIQKAAYTIISIITPNLGEEALRRATEDLRNLTETTNKAAQEVEAINIILSKAPENAKINISAELLVAERARDDTISQEPIVTKAVHDAKAQKEKIEQNAQSIKDALATDLKIAETLARGLLQDAQNAEKENLQVFFAVQTAHEALLTAVGAKMKAEAKFEEAKKTKKKMFSLPKLPAIEENRPLPRKVNDEYTSKEKYDTPIMDFPNEYTGNDSPLVFLEKEVGLDNNKKEHKYDVEEHSTSSEVHDTKKYDFNGIATKVDAAVDHSHLRFFSLITFMFFCIVVAMI